MQSVTKRVYAIDFSLAILGYILFVCMDTIAKDLVERYHVAQIIFVSAISALLPVLLYTQARNSWNKIGKANYKVHFFRTLTMFLAMATFFYCSNYLPLTTLYSIIFTAPFLLTIGAVIFLKEQVLFIFNAIKYFKKRLNSPSFYLWSNNFKNLEEIFKNHEITFIDNSDITDNLEKMHLDLYLMTKCKHYAVIPSSFNWWGAWLSNSDNKLVIRPKADYFEYLQVKNRDYWPDDWTIL